MPEYKPVAPKPLSEEHSKTTFTTKSTSGSEKLKGGVADNKPDSEFDPEQLKIGIKIESEHTSDPDKAKEVAKDHLSEIPDYYKRLTVMEANAEKEMNKSFARANELMQAMKVKYQIIKSIKESIDEEDMDLKKTDDEDAEETKKSLGYLGELAKALKASHIAGLSRRARLGAAYQAGLVVGRNNYLNAEPVDLAEGLDLGIDKAHTRPDYEPRTVPVRTIATPFEVPPKECGDHKYTTAKAGPTESKPFWRR